MPTLPIESGGEEEITDFNKHVIYFVTLGPHRQTKRVSDDGLHHNRTISGLKSDIVLNTKIF